METGRQRAASSSCKIQGGGTRCPRGVQAERVVSTHRFSRGQSRQDGLELVAVPGAEEGP